MRRAPRLLAPLLALPLLAVPLLGQGSSTVGPRFALVDCQDGGSDAGAASSYGGGCTSPSPGSTSYQGSYSSPQPTSSPAPYRSPTYSSAPQQYQTYSSAPKQYQSSSPAPYRSPTYNSAPQKYQTYSSAPKQYPTTSPAPYRSPTYKTAPQQYQTYSSAPKQYQTSSSAPKQYRSSAAAPQRTSAAGAAAAPATPRTGNAGAIGSGSRPTPAPGRLSSPTSRRFTGVVAPDGQAPSGGGPSSDRGKAGMTGPGTLTRADRSSSLDLLPSVSGLGAPGQAFQRALQSLGAPASLAPWLALALLVGLVAAVVAAVRHRRARTHVRAEQQARLSRHFDALRGDGA